MRPGEKQHEVLTAISEGPRLRDFGSHLVVYPPSSTSPGGEPVADDFQLRSDLAPQLNISEMRSLLQSEGWLTE